MKKVILLLTMLFFCNSNILAQKQIQAEEYAIYKVILQKLIITLDYKQIFIVNSTKGGESTYHLSSNTRELSQLTSDTRRNYDFRNRKSIEVRNDFGISLKVNLVTSDELLSLYRNYERGKNKNYEKAFEEMRFPVRFSRVGFDKNKHQALVEMGTYCGTRCGHGTFYLLTKKKGEWMISQELKTWIS